ncbi:MAG TPA: cytochrome c oxidase subunit II [Solirubrobacteraceae bacterium]|nr:cytochrome c oxidase subunit II [Solirubrobacteraceae bacterium]
MRRRPANARRTAVLLAACLSAVALGALAFAPGAFADLFTPQSGGSPNANNIDSLYKITLYVAIVIFVGVEGTLFYTLVRFRARRGAVPAQIRGNTRLEIGWTFGAAAILLVLAIVTFAKLSSIQDPVNSGPGGDSLAAAADGDTLYATSNQRLPPNGKSLSIKVIGRQFIWQYVYPGTFLKTSNPDLLGQPYTYEDMVVPTNTTVTLNIQSLDVVHSWWIPQLGGKFQAVPGLSNYTWFKIDKPGVYRGQCAEICGRLHAAMIAQVTAVPPAQFDQWLSNLERNIAAADAAAAAARTNLNSQTGASAVENP